MSTIPKHVNFIATDNVIVCVPLRDMRITTAYFIASMINHQKWRYGYGRQCYKEKLSVLTIQLPWRNGEINEIAIEKIIKRQSYWPYVKGYVTQSNPSDADAKPIIPEPSATPI